MNSKNEELTQTGQLATLSKEDILKELELSHNETVKYANKFLEVQEKWMFINFLLKRLNSIREKQELCTTICEGFLKLTNSKVCICCLFNQDTNKIEYKKISYSSDIEEKRSLANFIKKINTKCYEFLQKSTSEEEISEYFESFPKKQLIITPIIYNKNFLGYLAIIKKDANFYKENVHFISIFPEHIALILENISLYQESEKRNKQKIELLASISHEFKTPLNSIIGFSEILKSKSKNLENFKYVDNISQSSKYLLLLIEDVLDVTKSQYKTMELNYTTFRPKEIIAQVIETLEKMFKEKNIDLSYTLTDIKISADKKRFKQIIYNLVTNAIKFNVQNGKINICTYIKDNDFVFEITDTGDGISKKNHDKIFDFFSQVNRNQLKRQLGSGVGLALCKRILDAHQGKIDFKSQIKKGSCFWFSLPIKKPN